MKKYLFIALAALGFAACSETIDAPNGPIQGGELEESYIAINLMAADNDTRAADGGYQDGTPEERLVKTAYFFFFDANGDPFNVTASAPGGDKNYLSVAISEDSTSGMPNVSDIKEAVLILNTYKGVYPSQIVAVINWVPTEDTYSLEYLHENTTGLVGVDDAEGGYVMSNSVYMDKAGNMVDAVPLTAANIKTTEAEALAAPVEIYVERIAAKVELTASGKVANTENIFQVTEESALVPVGGTGITVYMKLHGWELYNDYTTSNILKNINNWDTEDLGLTWNDTPYFRCYWADSQDTHLNDSFSWSYASGFPTAYGFAVGSHTYCGENTWAVVIDSEGNVTPNPNNTKVILKGQLMQDDGNGGYKPLELARWYGNEYAGNEALRIAVANSLKYTLYYNDGSNFVSIKPDDIMCVKGADVGAEAYEVGFQLSNGGAEKTWYQYSSAGGYQVLGSLDSAANKTATNTYLKGVEPALLYANGMTYYSVDIEHLGTKKAKYGVVRNHVYQIDIQSIKGYGSPVYSGEIGFLKPEYPTEDEASYVSAKINVLSWKVVKQGVDIVQ